MLRALPAGGVAFPGDQAGKLEKSRLDRREKNGQERMESALGFMKEPPGRFLTALKDFNAC